MRYLDRRLKKQTKLVEAGRLLVDSVRPLQNEAASIYNRICPTHGTPLDDNFTAFKRALEANAKTLATDAAGSPHEPSVFVEVFENLPVIVEQMRALPKSNVREVRVIQNSEIRALEAFVEACKLGILWARIRELAPMLKSGVADEVIAFDEGWSREWVKQARKEAARDCKPLEAAMFYRFTQAYKWWKAGSMTEDAFFDKIREIWDSR